MGSSHLTSGHSKISGLAARECSIAAPLAFGKYSNMRDLQDNDETLFYSMIEHYTEELLPIVYTPTVGEGCQRFSEIWRQPTRAVHQLSQPGSHRSDSLRLAL